VILGALVAAALLAAPARAEEEQTTVCPTGTYRVATDDPYNPFKCVTGAEDKKKGFDAVVGPQGFATRPHCPHGTRPVAQGENSLQPYRCVRADPETKDPELAPMGLDGDDAPAPRAAGDADDPMTKGCPPGKRKVRTTDPLEPYHCVTQATRVHTLDEGSSMQFSIPRQIAFSYPTVFRVQDSWKEDVPTLYLKLENPGAGKPVTITITRYAETQSTYQEMSSAISRDQEWLGAQDGGTLVVAGKKARVMYVPGDTRSVYLPAGKDSYYSFVYSAPADTYENYLPAFTRLLKTLKLERDAR
jgi:hypothetical protein